MLNGEHYEITTTVLHTLSTVAQPGTSMMVTGVMKSRRQHSMAAALSNTRRLIICLRRLRVFKINPNIVGIVMAIIETIRRAHGDEE